MPRAIDKLVGPQAGQHIDAYQEYTNLVGRLDGGTPLPDATYQALRQRAANPARRLYVNWRNKATGLDCKAIGPQTLCFCQHRYNEHDWEDFETRRVRCKMPGCSCTCFNYIPVRGCQDLQCSSCHRSFREHRPDHSCGKGSTKFCSSYNCSCTGTYNEHETVFESRAEREQAGRPVDAGWMEKASREGLPVCHLGGILGFSSLADGVDRMMAGLEGDGVAQAVASRGAVMGDGGAQRFLGRCMLEDEVATASLLHGKEAGFRAIAKARRQPALAANSSAGGGSVGSRQRAISSGATRSVVSDSPRANVHTLGGAVAPTAVGAGQRPGLPQPTAAQRRGAAGEQRGLVPLNPKATPAPKRSSTSVPAPAAGRRLGGARYHDPAAMREARLARFES